VPPGDIPGDGSNLEQNWCRNPDNKEGGPWCFVETENGTWEYCDVPFCKRMSGCSVYFIEPLLDCPQMQGLLVCNVTLVFFFHMILTCLLRI